MKKLKIRDFTGTKNPQITQREINNRKLARKAAAEGMVLLKNDNNLLPLKKGSKIAIYGVGAGKTVKGGTGSGDVNERESVSIAEGLKNAGFIITTEQWIKNYDKKYETARMAWRDEILRKSNTEDTVEFFNTYSTMPFKMPIGDDISKTEADVAIFVLSRIAGEGADRLADKGDYYLSNEEEVQLNKICEVYSQVMVVINTGGIVDLSFMDKYENINALLQIMQPGMEGGNAFADIVLGTVTPSGKITDTWAFKYEDYPSRLNFSHNNGNVEEEIYEDGIYVGYRYFDTFDIPVRYGFGYGLSYASFEIAAAEVSLSVNRNDAVTLKAEVMNTSSVYSGKEVVQIYVTCPVKNLQKEYRRLVAFEKTELLAPGEKQSLTFTIPISEFTSYSESESGWILESGSYVLWAGNSLMTSMPVAVMRLDGDALLEKAKNICSIEQKIKEIAPNKADYTEKMNQLEEQIQKAKLPVIEIEKSTLSCKIISYRNNDEIISEESMNFVNTLTDEELIALATGDPGKGQGSNLGSAGISVPGSAGETNNCCLEKGLGSIVLADGPAGLRLNKFYNVHEGEIVKTPFQFSLEGGIFCPGLEDTMPGERYYQYCTAIPVGTLLAQTWDVKLLREIGQMVGCEMEVFNTTLWLAPGMNIHRNPLCGRNFEYYSEDPFLSGKMAAAITEGVQSVPGCGTTIKHFACNNQEDNRMGVNSILSERTLREIYLKGFEIAIKEVQPMAIMTSYNLINGIHAANNYDICTSVARNEWGFKGLIMTDWTTTENGPECTASGCIRAGNDLVMPGSLNDRINLREELDNGHLSKEDLKACIARIVEIIWKSNIYEGAVPYK